MRFWLVMCIECGKLVDKIYFALSVRPTTIYSIWLDGRLWLGGVVSRSAQGGISRLRSQSKHEQRAAAWTAI